jgi:ABC-2 type transport system permease protein
LPFGLPWLAAWSGPLVAGVMLLLARASWRLAVRHYRSTGS